MTYKNDMDVAFDKSEARRENRRRRNPTPKTPRRFGFTLVELLVVIGIISVLFSILLPVLASARRAGKRANCLSNMRNLAMAHVLYMNENHNYLIQAGLSHGGAGEKLDVAWINTLQKYYKAGLLLRSPADESIYWDVPVPGSGGKFRLTSYGINNFLDISTCPWGGPYYKVTQVKKSSAVVNFVIMATEGEFASADHPHVELWQDYTNVPKFAATQLAIGTHGGPKATYQSMSNYAFLDGHAETLRFRDVYTSSVRNAFDPSVAK